MDVLARTFVNVAATCGGTRTLGPGLRAAVWVQGCPFRCAGCLAPDWLPDRPARLVAPVALAAELLADPHVTGLTFSGGEPMAQAAGLAGTIRAARLERDVSLICFTGYTLQRLRSRPPAPGVAELLEETDVLIDGLYVASLNDNRGLRGSANQRIHHLTHRLEAAGYDFEGRRREAELHLDPEGALLAGVPPHGLATAVERAARRVHRNLLAPDGGLP